MTRTAKTASRKAEALQSLIREIDALEAIAKARDLAREAFVGRPSAVSLVTIDAEGELLNSLHDAVRTTRALADEAYFAASDARVALSALLPQAARLDALPHI